MQHPNVKKHLPVGFSTASNLVISTNLRTAMAAPTSSPTFVTLLNSLRKGVRIAMISPAANISGIL